MQKKKSAAELKLPAHWRELKSDIRVLRSEVKSGFNQMDSKFEQILSELFRLGSQVEEQNSRNQVVLEGFTGLYQR